MGRVDPQADTLLLELAGKGTHAVRELGWVGDDLAGGIALAQWPAITARNRVVCSGRQGWRSGQRSLRATEW
eukprot:COSAG01_NODE_198_length_22280_cov_21.529775_3_plen_72_part_00